MQTINTRDIQVGQRVRVDLGFGGGVIYEGVVTQKGAIFRDKHVPDVIFITRDDGHVTYALGEMPGEVLDSTQ